MATVTASMDVLIKTLTITLTVLLAAAQPQPRYTSSCFLGTCCTSWYSFYTHFTAAAAAAARVTAASSLSRRRFSCSTQWGRLEQRLLYSLRDVQTSQRQLSSQHEQPGCLMCTQAP